MDSILSEIIRREVDRTLSEIFKRPTDGILNLGGGRKRNGVKISSVSKKRKYADRLWRMIQDAYAYIGGCKTFDSKDGDDGFYDFLNGDYIWRIYFGDSSNDIKAAIIYKPTANGLKRVCSVGADKEKYKETMDFDFYKPNHVYGEVSGKSEHMLGKDKRTNWIPNDKVREYITNKDIYTEKNDEVDKSEKIPYDPKRHYYREIGGEMHRKSLFGNPIKRN